MTVERGKAGTREARRPRRGWVMGNPRYDRARARRNPARKDVTMGRN
jgi:hypothetical protein